MEFLDFVLRFFDMLGVTYYIVSQGLQDYYPPLTNKLGAPNKSIIVNQMYYYLPSY